MLEAVGGGAPEPKKIAKKTNSTKSAPEKKCSEGWANLDEVVWNSDDYRFCGSGVEGRVNLPPGCPIVENTGLGMRSGTIKQQPARAFFSSSSLLKWLTLLL